MGEITFFFISLFFSQFDSEQEKKEKRQNFSRKIIFFCLKKMDHKDMELKENGADNNGDFKETALLKNESKYKETPSGCCRWGIFSKIRQIFF